MTTIKTKRHNGGAIATYSGTLRHCTAYSHTPSCAIKKLADENFSSDSNTYKALIWWAREVAYGNDVRHHCGVSMAAIANTWFDSLARAA